jgi:hypothetical protein
MNPPGTKAGTSPEPPRPPSATAFLGADHN